MSSGDSDRQRETPVEAVSGPLLTLRRCLFFGTLLVAGFVVLYLALCSYENRVAVGSLAAVPAAILAGLAILIAVRNDALQGKQVADLTELHGRLAEAQEEQAKAMDNLVGVTGLQLDRAALQFEAQNRARQPKFDPQIHVNGPGGPELSIDCESSSPIPEALTVRVSSDLGITVAPKRPPHQRDGGAGAWRGQFVFPLTPDFHPMRLWALRWTDDQGLVWEQLVIWNPGRQDWIGGETKGVPALDSRLSASVAARAEELAPLENGRVKLLQIPSGTLWREQDRASGSEESERL